MHRASGHDNGPVGAIYQANVAGGEHGKSLQEGKVTRVEVEGDLLQMTGHVWVISPVKHWQGWKLESHDILRYDSRRLLRRKERRLEKGKGVNEARGNDN